MDLSAVHISQAMWLLGLAIIVLAIVALVRYFFQHLIHLLWKGCGLILIVAAALYVLHLLKLI